MALWLYLFNISTKHIQSVQSSLCIYVLLYIVGIHRLCLLVRFCSKVFQYDDYSCQYDGVKFLLIMTVFSHHVYCRSAIIINLNFGDFTNDISCLQT